MQNVWHNGIVPSHLHLFFFICLLQIPGVPLIFGLRNALFLESPSAFQRKYASTSEEGRLHMTEKEYQILRDRTMNRLAGDEAINSNTEIMENEDYGDQTGIVQAVKRSINSRNQMGIKDKPQFKRKRAKVIIYTCAVSFCWFES